MTTKRYLIVIEPTDSGFSAYSPDLPGCVAAGDSAEEVQQEMQGAIRLHLEGMRRHGYSIPEPLSSSSYVEVAG